MEINLTNRHAEHILFLEDALDKDGYLVKHSHALYDLFSGDVDRHKTFQQLMLKAIINSPQMVFLLEAATGSGKTVVAAFSAEHYLPSGDVVYVCHSREILEQVRKTFLRILPNDMMDKVGYINEFTKINRVHLLTPASFVKLQHKEPTLFKDIVDRSSLLIIDEAHHYPLDKLERLKIYGEVERLARKEFAEKGKKVLAMTGALWRGDGLLPMGKLKPDYKFTVQDANDKGICPNIYGISVKLDIKFSEAKKQGDFYVLKGMTKGDRINYFLTIADCMALIYQRNPKPFCAFTNRVKEAVIIANKFNRISGLGERGLAVLSGRVSHKKRQEIIAKIKRGELVGYIAVRVGVEGIDIPAMEVVHVIARTSSVQYLMQCVGRVLRICEETNKRRALVIDYNFKTNELLRGMVGFYELAEVFDGKVSKDRENLPAVVPLVVQACDEPMCEHHIATYDLSNEMAWVIKGQPVTIPAPLPLDAIVEELRRLAELDRINLVAT